MSVTDIIIVNYNTNKMLSACLRSIYRATSKGSFRVIVIDNGSKHPPRLARWPNLTTLRNETNGGLAAAWNQGIMAGKGEYIVVLNPDLRVTSRWLAKMIRYAESRPNIAVVGCKHINQHGKIVHAGLDFHGRYRYKGLSAQKYGNKAELALSVSGGCFLVKRANLPRLGLFDQKYFLYYEDTDYAINAWRKGFKVLYCPVSVWHNAHGSPISRKLRSHYIRDSKRYFRQKWNLNL